MHDHHTESHGQIVELPRETEGLPGARETEVVELADGDEFSLEIRPVKKRIGDATVRMLAYNGSVPGPTLKVAQGGTITVHVSNHGDLDATVHWHGLRLENRYDGTHETQAPIQVGERFTARVQFPDPGAYWYHPHIREDYGQEMGLYGSIVVVPSEPEYWPPVDRELALTLDYVLLEDGRIAPFSASETTYVAMGRFGNVLLANGEPELVPNAENGAEVACTVESTGGGFKVSATLNDGPFVRVSVPTLSDSNTSDMPAEGSVEYASDETGGDVYSNTEPCEFYVDTEAGQFVRAGEAWFTFECPAVQSESSSCGIGVSYVALRNCVGTSTEEEE